MNIFYLSKDPYKAAKMLCDKHLVKMILETAQLLSSAHHVLESSHCDKVYKLTHKNHPCAIWVRETDENYLWLFRYGLALLAEYAHRYVRVHKSITVYAALVNFPEKIPHGTFTPPPKCMPDEYKAGNTITAYRRYYVDGKKHIKKRWTNRNKPAWHN